MAHLHINGIQVKTRQGYDVSYQEVMQRRGYSPNGNYQFARNGIGRKWRFQTIPLPRDEAQALAAMLNMRGDHWRWDLAAAANGVEYVTDDSTSNVWSDKRRVPQAAEADCTIVSAYGADGSRVYDWNGNAYAPFSGCTGSLLVEPGTTNIMSAAESDPESGAVGWLTDGSSTVTATTDHCWRGSGSANVYKTGSSRTAQSSARSVSINTDYVFSCYVKPPPESFAGETIPFRITSVCDSSGSTITQNTTLPAGYSPDAWYRIYGAFTTDGSDTTATIQVTCFSGNTDFQIDGALLEVDPGDGFPTAWVDAGADPWGSGTAVRPAGVLDFDTFVAGYTQGITVSAWVNMQYTGATGNRFIFDSSDTNPRTYLYLGTTDKFGFAVLSSDGSALSFLGSTQAVGWHHVVATYDPRDTTARLYVDGVLDATDNTWSVSGRTFSPVGMTGDLSIGTAGIAGSATLRCPLGPISVLPYAVPASFVTKWYNSGTDDVPVPGLLPLAAHGDFLGAGEKDVRVYAQVNSVTNLPYHDATNGWESGAAVVDFTLMEATAL